MTITVFSTQAAKHASGQQNNYKRFRAYHRHERRNPDIGKIGREITARSVIGRTSGACGINRRVVQYAGVCESPFRKLCCVSVEVVATEGSNGFAHEVQ